MASGTIRGITVEIGGDTTKLGKAIEDSEKKSRALQLELKDVQKMLKFDPSNVELLTQKQAILTNNIKETSDKLDVLKEAEAQVIAQFQRGEVAEEQVRALQREIIKTEGVLGNMKSELSSTETALTNLANGVEVVDRNTREYRESIKDAEQELESFKGKASEAFDTLKVGAGIIGGAMVATGGYALKLTTDFDQAFNSMIAQTGATEDEINELNTAMEGVYANNFGESIEDVANSMAIVKQNTKLAGGELQKTTEDALLFRDVFGFEVEESTRSATMLMQQFGLTADQAYNLMAQGAQDGLNKNGDLMDVINEYSVHFEQMGFDAEEMFNILIAGSESGAFSVDKVGDAFKEFGIRVKDESDATKGAFKQLGLDADVMSKAFAKGGDDAVDAYLAVNEALIGLDDPLKQNQLGVALYGTMWEDLGSTVIGEMANFGDQFNSTRDTMKSINEVKYDDIGSALQGLGRTLETDVILPLGEELKPVVEDAIEYVKSNGPAIKDVLSELVSKVGDFVGFVVNNGPTIISLLAGIGAGMLAWNVASMINGVVTAISAYRKVNEGATIAQALFNAVLNANPIMLIVTAVIAVVTALAVFIATNDDARAKFVEIWNKIKEVGEVVLDALATFFTETLPNAIQTAIDWFVQLPGKIQNAISNLVTSVTTIFTNIKNTIFTIAQEIYNNLPSGFQLVIQNIGTILQNMANIFTNYFNIIKTIVQTVIDVIKAIFSGDFSSIPGIVLKALTKIREYVSNILDSAVTIIVNIIAIIINYFRGLGETWINIFKNIGSKLSTWWTNLKTSFTNMAKNVIDAVINWFVQLPGKIYNAIVGAISKVQSWGSSMLSAGKTAINNLVNNVVTIAKSLPEKIYNGIKNAVSKVKSWGSELVSAGKNAINNMITNVTSTAKSLPGKFKEIGKNVIEGIKSGITGALSGLYSKIKSGLSGLVDKAKDALGIHSPSRVFANIVGKQIPAGIAKGIEDNTDIADDAVYDMTDDLTKQALNLNGATINRQLTTTFNTKVPDNTTSLLNKLDSIYEKLSRLQIVLDTGTLVGETIDAYDRALSNKQTQLSRGW